MYESNLSLFCGVYPIIGFDSLACVTKLRASQTSWSVSRGTLPLREVPKALNLEAQAELSKPIMGYTPQNSERFDLYIGRSFIPGFTPDYLFYLPKGFLALPNDKGNNSLLFPFRCFNDDERQLFKKASRDGFLMSVAHPLGSLDYLRIWTDSSGLGENLL